MAFSLSLSLSPAKSLPPDIKISACLCLRAAIGPARKGPFEMGTLQQQKKKEKNNRKEEEKSKKGLGPTAHNLRISANTARIQRPGGRSVVPRKRNKK